MRIDAVDFTATTRYPSRALRSQKSIPTNNKKQQHTNQMKTTDIIPITGLLGVTLMSAYLIKKGNLDVGIRSLHI